MPKRWPARRAAISASADIIRRKLRSDGARAPEAAVSPVKALRLGLARAADQAFGLALRVNAIRQSRLELGDVVDGLADDWALYPLLHEDGSVGVIGLDRACVVALVEQQTTGRLISASGEARGLTRTDKALAQPLLMEFLRRFSDALAGAPTAYWTCGYRAEDAVQSRHLMALQLEAPEYRGFDVSAECLENGRSCRIVMYLPIKSAAQSVAPQMPGKTRKTAAAAPPKASLRSAALPAQLRLNAVLCKVSLPLDQLRLLEPGQLLALPRDAADQARLEDMEGGVSFPIRLGQLNGLRAVRIDMGEGPGSNAPPPQALAQQEEGELPLEADEPTSPVVRPEQAAPRSAEQENAPQDTPATRDEDELDALLQSDPAL